jgi:hypothetical protein
MVKYYHRYQNIPVKKRRRYLKPGIIVGIIGLVLLTCAALAAAPYVQYYVESYTYHEVEEKLFHQVNEDRANYGVTHIIWDSKLSSIAYYRAAEIANADINGQLLPLHKDYIRENYFSVSVDDFERDYYYSPQIIMDGWRNMDEKFRMNELNRDHIYVGIGVSKANNDKYYVVFEWSKGEGLGGMK